MAYLYHSSTSKIEDKIADIRPIDEEDYHVAITFHNNSDNEDDITEVLLTADEVQRAHDVLFNR